MRTECSKLIVNFSAASAFMDPSQSWRPRTITVVPPRPARASTPLVELYGLAADPLEHRTLADDPAHAHTRRALLGRLYECMRTTDDPLLRGAVTPPMHGWAVEALVNATDAPRVTRL